MGLDVELTGLGPLFSAEIVMPGEEKGTPPTIISLSATVSSVTPEKYQVDYSIGARIAVATSHMSKPGGPSTTNFEFRDVLLRGAALVTKGKSLTVSKISGKELKLTLSKPSE